MIGDSHYWNGGYGTDAVRQMLRYVFTSTWLRYIYLHTLVGNERAQRAFAKAGFLAVREVRKDGFDFLRMEITRERWEELEAERQTETEDEAEPANTLRSQPAGSASAVDG